MDWVDIWWKGRDETEDQGGMFFKPNDGILFELNGREKCA